MDESGACMKPDFGISGLSALLIPVFICTVDDTRKCALQEKFGKSWEKMAIYARNSDFRILKFNMLILMYFLNYM